MFLEEENFASSRLISGSFSQLSSRSISKSRDVRGKPAVHYSVKLPNPFYYIP